MKYTGTVLHGEKIARTLGFPTANIIVAHTLKPSGVYCGYATVDDVKYPAVMCVGRNNVLEVHIIDFSKDNYGVEITVEVTNFIRVMKKIEDVNVLKNIIAGDVNYSCRVLGVNRENSEATKIA